MDGYGVGSGFSICISCFPTLRTIKSFVQTKLSGGYSWRRRGELLRATYLENIGQPLHISMYVY